MTQFIDSLVKKAQELKTEREKIELRIQKDQARLNDLIGAISGIETLLRVEGAAPTEPTPTPPATKSAVIASVKNGANPPRLYDVLHEALADGKPHALPELITFAVTKGVEFGEKSPPRAVSFTLLGIAKGKKIERMDDGKWRRAA